MVFIGIGLIILFGFVLYMSLNTLRLHKDKQAVEPYPPQPFDKKQLAQFLSEAVKIKTISKAEMKAEDYKAFLQFHQWLQKTFPNIHNHLTHEIINRYSLLYKWQGSNPDLKPVLISAHMDVVPVEESTLKQWHADPFAGEIQEGFVWGRGSLDMKHHIVTSFSAVEKLIHKDYTPKRTIYFAIGHDEEISGKDGARQIAAHFKNKGIRLAALLDEGGMISRGLLPDVSQDIAVIGIGEKEYATVNLSAEGNPGHSSNPPRQTAIGIIARALALLDDNPMKPRLDFILPTLRKIAYLFQFPFQMVIANHAIFREIIIKNLEQQPQTNALMRTTHAATVIRGGIKDNVLPAEASAKVNFRILPGDGTERVLLHIRKTINDPRVNAEIDDADAWGPCKVSNIDTAAYRTLALVIRQIFGNQPVAPLLLMFATDARHYQDVCDQLYHFTPLCVQTQDLARLHGIDERISIEGLEKMAQFFSRLITVWGDAEF